MVHRYLKSLALFALLLGQPAFAYDPNVIKALNGDVSATGNTSGTSAATVNSVGGQSAANVASATATANSCTAADTPNACVKRDGSGNFVATLITGALSGNASTATALAANPVDCSSNQFANAIAANGDLTCAGIPNAATSATSANTPGAIVARDVGGNFSAGSITAALIGNSSTATAFAANPTDCSANQYAFQIDAQGNLTCSQPSLTAFTGILPSSQGGTGQNFSATTGVLKVDAGVVSAVAPCAAGNVLTSNGTTWSCQGAPLQNYQFENFSLNITSDGSNMHIQPLGADGIASLSASNPALFSIWNGSSNNTGQNTLSFTDPTEFVIPSGGSLAQASGVNQTTFIYIGFDYGVPGQLGLCVSSAEISENTLVAATAISSGSTSGSLLYCNSASVGTTVAVRQVGKFVANHAGGAWDTNPVFQTASLREMSFPSAISDVVANITAGYTIKKEKTVICSTTAGTFPVTLPPASSRPGDFITVRNIGSGGACTLTRVGSDTIDGSNTFNVGTDAGNNNNGLGVTIVSTGSGWKKTALITPSFMSGTSGAQSVLAGGTNGAYFQNGSSVNMSRNLGIAASTPGSSLFVAINDASGGTPSATNLAVFGNRATSGGGVNTNSWNSSTGSTLQVNGLDSIGCTGSIPCEVKVYAMETNSATPDLCLSFSYFNEEVVQTSTALGTAGTNNSATTLYCTNANSNRGIRLLGYVTATHTGSSWGSATIRPQSFSRITPSPTTQILSSSTTYVLPQNPVPKYIRVEEVGTGGAGGGSGTGGTGTGATGADTTFGSTAVVATGGAGGGTGDSNGAGGSFSLGAGVLDCGSSAGSAGNSGMHSGVTTVNANGGLGGGSVYGSGGRGAQTGAGGGGVAPGSGGGGAGGLGNVGGMEAGAGGGAGGYACGQINAPLTSYAVVIGSSATGGTAGTSGNAGGNSAAGRVKVTEFY